MVEKVKRETYKDDTYNIIITDKLGNKFTMFMGGNGDLYWLPEDKQNTVFYIDKSDTLMFKGLTKLFKFIKERDDVYNLTLKENIFTFISEDRPIDEANILKITNSKQEFIIEFIKTELKDNFSVPKRWHTICFCNSGSRVPRIEQLFQIMFIELAYYVKEVSEKENNL
ncbi:MAG: hypothetical protein IKM43_03500 [Clostridia bacterium]|nr:hypothetical protein [Clostridia bacterium]